ncbi:family protein [Stylonychia lemnae]|uniref:Family protein n=1 Tax=Stylonychia lemnae TaxID=5949 RepID=A0A078AS71_STYLE|nr:family protein [Stylonychia lemnae]|eukprot:CDW85019.1 family protein [Stylonychia lemnae]
MRNQQQKPEAINESQEDFCDYSFDQKTEDLNDRTENEIDNSQCDLKSESLEINDHPSFSERQFMSVDPIDFDQKCWPTTKFFTMYQWRDLRRHKCHFCLALCSVFIIVLSTLIVTSVVNKGPVIFLKMAEANHGEIDAFISPAGYDFPTQTKQQEFLNFTAVQQAIKPKSFNLSPRKLFCGTRLTKIDRDREKEMLKLQKPIQQKTDQTKTERAFLKVQDPNMSIENQNQNGKFIGDIAHLEIKIENLYRQFIKNYNNQENLTEEMKIDQPKYFEFTKTQCKIKATIDQSYGKFREDDMENLLIMEYSEFMNQIIQRLPNEILRHQDLRDYIDKQENVRLDHYADHLVMTMPYPRINWYSNSNYDDTQNYVIEHINQLVKTVGFYPVQVKTFLLKEMMKYNIALLLFSLIFNLVLLIFIVISILLIYSLIMIGVEQKTFETGIMRMVGISKKGLILMVLLQSSMFVTPALILALVMSIPSLAIGYSYVFDESEGNGYEPYPTFRAIFFSFIVGVLIPILSSIIPLMKVMSQNLTEALSYERSRVKAIYIEILRADKVHLLPQIAFGILTFIYGLLIYYVLPLSMLTYNLGLILDLFFLILMGMLFGLCVIAINLQNTLEIILTYIFLFWEKKSMKLMVLNNLKAHLVRNRLTASIFSMALSFIIFVMVSYKLQMQNRDSSRNNWYGSVPTFGSRNQKAINPVYIDPVLRRNANIIDSFTYFTYDMHEMDDSLVGRTMITNRARVQQFKINLNGVQPNIFEPSEGNFLDLAFKSTGLSIGEQLYSSRGNQGAAIGTFILKTLMQEPSRQNWDKQVRIELYLENSQFVKYQLRPVVMLNQAPMFQMTDREEISPKYGHSMLVSLPMFTHYAGVNLDQLKYQRVSIKLNDKATREDEQRLYFEIKRACPGIYSQQIWLASKYRDNVEQVDFIVSSLFNVIIAITMLLCFFSLSSSMSANLYDQSKEIAILRAVGLKKSRVIFLYIYEAFILVVASSLLGTLVGTAIGWSMTIQFSMFQRMPLQFFFPWKQLLVVFLIAIFCAILSTYGPVRQLMKLKIANLLKLA